MSQLAIIEDDDMVEVLRDLNEAVQHLVTEDDTPVDNLFSEKQQRLLTEPLYSSWIPPADEEHPDKVRHFLAAANVGLFPTIHQPALVPDVFLSLDVKVHKDWYEKNHRSYFIWEFGKAPEVVIEIVSNRKGGEMTGKLRDYARINFLYYVVFDPTRQINDDVLLVYELSGKKYRRRKDYQLPIVGLSLKLWEGSYEKHRSTWLRWYDQHDKLILTGAEKNKQTETRLRAERKARRAETERAAREAERAARLAARLRELGIDPDQI